MGVVVEELQSQPRLCLGSLRDDEQTTGVLVDAMDESHLRIVGVEARVVLQMPRHGINQCAMEVAGTGMNHHASGLVHNHQVVVLVDDVERDIFCLDRAIVAWTVEHKCHHVAWPYLIVTLHWSVVHMHEAGIGSLLNAVARRVLHLLLHVFVNTQGSLPGVYDEAEVLVQLGAFYLIGASILLVADQIQLVKIFVVHAITQLSWSSSQWLGFRVCRSL